MTPSSLDLGPEILQMIAYLIFKGVRLEVVLTVGTSGR
jgi:hypothetical protein